MSNNNQAVAATEAKSKKDESAQKEHRAGIETAPKTQKIVAWHPTTNTDVVLEWDESWGSGRGAWFDDKNRVVSPKEWNPLQTGLYKL